MKKFKVSLSVFMVLIIISVSIVPSFATDVISTSQAIIREDLLTRMNSIDDDEKIKVYLWYKDIDQNKVDSLTAKATGLTPEDCKVIDTVSLNDSVAKSIDFTKSEEEVLRDFIEKTSEQRRIEKERVTIYTKTRREISSEMYREKSAELINSLDLKASDMEFESQYAPLLIANMSVDEIAKAKKLGVIEEIGYYEEPVYIECSDSEETEEEKNARLAASALTAIGANKINAGTNLNLTGEGIKVGLIENNRVSFYEELAGTQLYGKWGIVPENATPTDYSVTNGVVMHDYGNVVVVGNSSKATIKQDNGKAIHADATAKTLLSVSPNIKLYSTQFDVDKVEGMVEDGVNIFNISVGMNVEESSDEYTYNIRERWFDHLVSFHGVTVLKSAGNKGDRTKDEPVYDPEQGKYVIKYGPRVTAAGLAHNVITVGSYKQNTELVTDDALLNDSSYQNCITRLDGTTHYGCEKPDVVMPGDFNGGGTSMATPLLSGLVALMFELKPSLSNSPHELKAIVLASCHRKVNQPESMGGQETMTSGIPGRQVEGTQSGITERQGAGAPDGFTMACIVCQGTYGSGEINSANSYINIVQPPYGATNMNVSLAFIKENIPSNNHDEADISNGVADNLDLAVYRNNTLLRESALLYSSTEMCYVPLNSTNFRYRIKIKRNNTEITTKYGYAWSTDNMKAVPEPTLYDEIAEGVYHIKNKVNTQYAQYNTSATSNTEKAKLGYAANISPSLLNDEYKWIVNPLGNGYSISTGYGTVASYLGVADGSQQSSTLLSTMSSSTQNLILTKNDDGTYSLFNSSSNRILSYDSSSRLVWKSYSTDIAISDSEKWYFEKCNYLRGDVDLDGVICSMDATCVQTHLLAIETLDNIGKFIADVDRDGYISSIDATIIQQMAASLA